MFRRKPFESLLAVKESIMLSQSRQMWTTAKLNTRFLSRTWLSAHCGVTTHAHTRTHTRAHALTHTWKRTINENVQTLSCHLRNDHTAKKFMLGKNRYSRIDPVFNISSNNSSRGSMFLIKMHSMLWCFYCCKVLFLQILPICLKLPSCIFKVLYHVCPHSCKQIYLIRVVLFFLGLFSTSYLLSSRIRRDHSAFKANDHLFLLKATVD